MIENKGSLMKTAVSALVLAAGLSAFSFAADSSATPNSTADSSASKPALKSTKMMVKGHCIGVNACKGQGECAGKGHGCAGKNDCKGKGWVTLSKADCKAQSGKFVKAKSK